VMKSSKSKKSSPDQNLPGPFGPPNHLAMSSEEFGVKVMFDDTTGTLKPGLPATVEILPDGGGR